MFAKGKSGNPKGRAPGSKNKTTTEIKEFFTLVVGNNVSNLERWIAEAAEKDPARAFDMTLRLSEFIVPKMKAVELTGKDGRDLIHREIVVQSKEAKEALEKL